MITRASTRLVGCGLAVVLMLGACGDDDEAEATTTTAAEKTTTTTKSELQVAEAMDVFAQAACLRFDTDGTSDAVADEVYAAQQQTIDQYEGDAREQAETLFFLAFVEHCPDHAIPYGQAEQRAGS